MSVCSFPGMVLSHHQGSCSPRDTKRFSCTRRVPGVWFSDQLRGLWESLWLQGGLKNEPPKEVPSLVKHAVHIPNLFPMKDPQGNYQVVTVDENFANLRGITFVFPWLLVASDNF